METAFWCNLLIFVKKATRATELYIELKKVLTDIDKDIDDYLIEVKLQTVDGHKTRLYVGDVFGLITLERAYNRLKFIKIDVVARVDNKFYEISCIYMFYDREEKLSKMTSKSY